MYVDSRWRPRSLVFLFCFVAATLSTALSRAAKEEIVELALEVGEQRVISTDGVRSYSEGVPGIVEVRLTKDARQFVVVGQRVGSTSLLFILGDGDERHYRITVTPVGGAVMTSDLAGPSHVEARDNVRLDFYFVDLSSTSSRNLGMGWPASFGGGTASASFDLLHQSFESATAVVTNQALPRLDFAESEGFAKILRKAAVITANGTEATFAGGGEVNVRVQGALAAEIRSIPFGSTVKVLPRYDRDSGRIELSLDAEVSDLTADTGTGAPGRSKSELKTVVNLELGQSLVLAGLTARSESRTRSGLAFLSQIPILGVLFATTASQEEDSQNLIFIVPTVVDSVPPSARESVKEALSEYEHFDGDLRDVRLVPEAPESPRRKANR
jgi:pilus assembly protein CpaC